MAITIASKGSGTLPTNNNAISTVDVSDTNVSTGDTIIIMPTIALPTDLKYNHNIYVYSLSDGVGFTVRSSYKDIPSDITFDYAIFTGTA